MYNYKNTHILQLKKENIKFSDKEHAFIIRSIWVQTSGFFMYIFW